VSKFIKTHGSHDQWENWAGDVAKIAQTHITRINALLEKPDTTQRLAFNSFLKEIKEDLNDSITEGDAIEMLAQHIITKPVFDALFEGYSFTSVNPVSIALQKVLDVLDLEKESESLQKFYASVRRRAAGINNATAKQQILVELYDKFFRTAFPRMTQQLGIVYTPVEIVDFIIHSVNEALQSEFGRTLGSTGVHILDPFTGTGTFITRLLQSGLIKPEELEHKYRHEIHANEIVLLAYYIAAINIESVYHDIADGQYVPFDGICLTDTFELNENERDLVSEMLVENSNHHTQQKKLNIRVIFGNPPYSIGQKSENDNAANVSYPKIDDRIRKTYARHSNATLSKGLYDSYVRAIRWASDRIGKLGIIGFVSGSSYITKLAMDGMRHCLLDEFSKIYIINLRGDIRKNMLSKGHAKEGQNVFGNNSMTGIAISIFIKNSQNTEKCSIYYHDIGDDLKSLDKIEKISDFKHINGINNKIGWQHIVPDEHADWLNQRDKNFDNFIKLGDKKIDDPCLFENFSLGVVTNRDSWVYNSSCAAVEKNMRAMISIYNNELARFNTTYSNIRRKERDEVVNDFINTDPTKISWTRSLKNDFSKNKNFAYDRTCLTPCIYRPFTRQWLYYSRTFNEMVYQMPRIFPMGKSVENRVIQINAKFNGVGMIALMSNQLPDLHCDGDSQCFPRFLYNQNTVQTEDIQGDLLNPKSIDSVPKYRDAITDAGLAYFQAVYPGDTITKDDIFYYVYGILHSKDYQQRYKDNLSKQLPRIPAVKKINDFRVFVEAGRKLGDLHCNFDKADLYPVQFDQGDTSLIEPVDPKSFYRIEQMKFAGKRPDLDKTTVIYNENITISAIPLKAYEYVVNGKSALEWVMERQCVKTDKASGIVNDANSYANETVGEPDYPLKLFQRVITVSLETLKIVETLPLLGDSLS
jgi:predicted helicase